MIHSITSDLDSFKSLTFELGLNIILAEKSVDASDRQSRNGAGKTSFVELIHFMFGGSAKPDSIFRTDELVASTFEMQTDIGGHVIFDKPVWSQTFPDTNTGRDIPLAH